MRRPRIVCLVGPTASGKSNLTLPFALWQVAHDFPTAEFMRVATSQKMLPVGPVELFTQQVLAMHQMIYEFCLNKIINKAHSDETKIWLI